MNEVKYKNITDEREIRKMFGLPKKNTNPYRDLAFKFSKIAEEFCNKVSLEDYTNLSTENYAIKYKNDNNKTLGIVTEQYQKSMVRSIIVDILSDINYKRGDKKWISQTVIAYMDEVIKVFTEPYVDEKVREEVKKEIGKRYNVPVNRLKTQLALFIINLDKGVDKYNIKDYFTAYEIFKWKYRDEDKLQKATENNTLSKMDKQIIEELYNI